MPNPLAPISHHWLDATHITFGVVTAGIACARVESRGLGVQRPRTRRPARWNLDLAPLDSVSARVWYLPTPQLALQISAGHLEEAEADHGSGVRADVDRLTASATYHRPLGHAWQWASTVAFGANREAGVATAALLVETSLALRDRDTWFGRFEWAEKSADDLGIHFITAIYDVAKLQLGYTAYFPAWRRLTPWLRGQRLGGVRAAVVGARLRTPRESGHSALPDDPPRRSSHAALKRARITRFSHRPQSTIRCLIWGLRQPQPSG